MDKKLELPPLIIEEYEALWKYYEISLNERHKFLDYAYRAVAVPLTVAGGFIAITSTLRAITTLPGVGTNSLPFIFDAELWKIVILCILGTSFFIGISSFVAYTFETANSKRYMHSINRIRNFVEMINPGTKEILIISRFGNGPQDTFSLTSIATIRGSIPMLINSSIGASLIPIYINSTKISIIFAIFLALMFMHYVLGRYISSLYETSPPDLDYKEIESIVNSYKLNK